jgi:hypothetical protein
MQTSRFQLGLIATLAVGFGFSLSASEAIGYPAGSAVSRGSNPVWNVAGTFTGTGGTTVYTSSGHAIITDVLISGSDDRTADVTMRLDDGTEIGRFLMHGASSAYNESYPQVSLIHTFSGGLVVPEGRTLQMSTTRGTMYYTLSGYYAQP